MVRCSITDNGETALHIAASAKGPKKVDEFVRNLVGKMEKEDLELVNKNQNTALYLAAAAGNIETVKIMMAKNPNLHTIPGANGSMMPLYAAVLFGNKDVVRYLYKLSKHLGDDNWNPQNRSWLLEKCVESDMFDIAIEIVKMYPALGRSSTLLGVLARKPQAFHDKKSNIIERTIKLGDYLYSSVFTTHQPSQNKLSGPGSESAPKHLSQPAPSPDKKSNVIARTFKSVSAFFVGEPEKDTEALQLLRIIWEDIVKLSKKEIDNILRGPADPKKLASSGRVAETILLQCIYEHLEKLETSFRNVNGVSQQKILISEHLVKMHLETQNIIKQDNKAPQELEKLISEYLVKMHDGTQNVIRETGKDQPQRLKDFIFYQTYNMRHLASKKETQKENIKEPHSSRVLFVAAEMGNTKFLVELIRRYPDLIWKVNDDNQSIFHIAVKHRHEGIYNLLYEIGAMKDMITPLKDEDENNMLHLVGKTAKQKRLADVSGFALQMQRELLWFEEVKNMIPPSYRERKNKEGLTTHELFAKEHKELVTQGEKWMKGTANQCMVVAALIATIVFAAAFTVPGGYDQNDGIPMFYSKATFVVFVVADAISLFASSASILIFLSILTSRYAEHDFLKSIPNKLMAGLATLFISIATMTLAFGVSFFVLYKKGFLWIPILIGVFALLPVILYLCLQYGLFSDIIRSTYGSRYLFKPKKHVLYYENPKMKQQEGVQLASIDEEKPLSNIQQQDIHIPAASQSTSKPLPPKLPCVDLINDPQWRNAMYNEYNALVKNGTWLLVPRPTGVNMVRSMWLFKHKFHADGTLSRYKARLVANGSSQQLGVDFDETFSPVVKPATIRTVLSLVVSRKWPIHQLDVKNAFLNGDLSETVYMHQPPGFVDARFPNHVCRLQRSLYGLKQAPRAWFQRFAGYATRAGFYHSRCDSSLFIYRQGSQVAYLLLYVDDIILTASSTTLLQQLIDSLHREFDMTDLGALNYFLGISVVRHSTGLFLSQRKYALQLLERAHMVNCNPSRTPVDTESKLGANGVPV
ncbi:ankyrin repeat-containing domain, PGG domain protein [Tanacetum coccineum]